MKLYECGEHGDRFFLGVKKGCECCARILRVIRHNKEVHGRTPKIPRLQMSVYWPSRIGHEGRLIENLEHKPKYFSTKREYRDYLKRHRVMEAG